MISNRSTVEPYRAIALMSARVVAMLVALLCAFVAAASPALASNTTTYSYDPLGRLVSVGQCATVANTSRTSSYTYDAADNRTQVAANGGTTGTVLGLSPTSLPGGFVGTAYSQSFAASGGLSPYTYQVSAGTLPAGLALSAASLSGTPTTAANYSFTITATDTSGNTGSCAYNVPISASLTPVVSPASLPNGAMGTPYDQTITATGGSGGYTFSVSSGALPTGLTLTSSSGQISGTPQASGTYSFTITATDSTGHTGSRAYSVTISMGVTLTVYPNNTVDGWVGQGYSSTFSASGGTGSYTFSKSSGTFPPGLSFNGSTGVLSGTFTKASTYNFTIMATDTVGDTGSRAYSITVQPVTLAISPTSLPGGKVGTAYSQTISASGGAGTYTYSRSAGTVPPGLTLHTATGVLSGTPTTAGTYSFTISASDTGGDSGSRAYSVTIGNSTGVCGNVSFTVNNVEVTEGDPLVFTVTKTGSTSSSCSLSYATADGTAYAGTNYVAKSGTLTFSSTQTSQTVTVTTYGGEIPKNSRTMYLNLSNPSGGAGIPDNQGIGTIDSDGSICLTCSPIASPATTSTDPGTTTTTSDPPTGP